MISQEKPLTLLIPYRLIFTLTLLFLVAATTQGQQPFVTDDTDVTPRHKFELEVANEFDILPRLDYPALRQNGTDFGLNYGLFEKVEIGLAVPLLAISSSHVVTPKNVFGVSDSTLHLKYNFYKEREKSRLPAMAIEGLVQFHTGDVSKGLGSGLTDYFVNGILQKTVTSKTMFRLNGGILFSGNLATGQLGIKTRGRVFTAGASVVKTVSKKLDLGVEITGAVTSNFDLGAGQLQSMIGGNYVLNERMTFDFGVVAGHFAASPRVGVVLGFTRDF